MDALQLAFHVSRWKRAPGLTNLELAKEVRIAEQTPLAEGSEADTFRDYLCKIAASRLAKVILD